MVQNVKEKETTNSKQTTSKHNYKLIRYRKCSQKDPWEKVAEARSKFEKEQFQYKSVFVDPPGNLMGAFGNLRGV